jgi:cytochrome P450
VDRVLGERTEITYEDVSNLKYCSCVFKESLRLWPPVASIDRQLTETIEIDGYQVPKGTPIIVIL